GLGLAEHVRHLHHLRAERGDDVHGVAAEQRAGGGGLGDDRSAGHVPGVRRGGGDREAGVLERGAGVLTAASALIGDLDRLPPLRDHHVHLAAGGQGVGGGRSEERRVG